LTRAVTAGLLCAEKEDGQGDNTMRANRIRKIVASVAAASFLAASSANAQAQPDWAAVTAAAKQEGKLTVYGTGVVIKAVIEKFQTATGIATQLLEGRTTEIRERIRTEQTSGRVNADVTSNGAVTSTNMMREGRFDEHGPLPALGKIVAPFKDDGILVPFTANVLALVVNSNLVKPEDQPKSWNDLNDPKWKGKILLDEPRVGGVGYVFFAVTYEKLGRAYQESFAAQKPVIVPDAPLANRRVAQGEFPLYVGFSFQDWRGLKGLPLRVVIPQEGALYSTLNVSIVKGAPHPNAAKLFLNFVLEDEAQRAITGLGSLGTTGVVAPDAPADVQALLRAKLWGSSNPEDQTRMNALAAEIYK
jgi:iron(III) transport system substrate-binding protein